MAEAEEDEEGHESSSTESWADGIAEVDGRVGQVAFRQQNEESGTELGSVPLLGIDHGSLPSAWRGSARAQGAHPPNWVPFSSSSSTGVGIGGALAVRVSIARLKMSCADRIDQFFVCSS